MASFRLDADVSALFPYINAVCRGAELFQDPYLIRFCLAEHYCLLHPDRGIASPIEDLSQATAFVDHLVLFLKDLHSRKDEIRPNHKIHRRVSVVDIIQLLPRTNCGECGFASCMAFAGALSIQDTQPRVCPHLGFPVAQQALYPVFDESGRIRSTVALDVKSAESDRDRRPSVGSPVPTRKSAENRKAVAKPVELKANASLPTPLTGRELEVLRMVAHGNTNTEISRQLNISPHTVKSHVVHIFNKLGVNDRTQAAVWAARQKIV